MTLINTTQKVPNKNSSTQKQFKQMSYQWLKNILRKGGGTPMPISWNFVRRKSYLASSPGPGLRLSVMVSAAGKACLPSTTRFGRR